MATALTSIFGSEIKAYFQPRQAARQYAAFPGASGVIGLHLGTRGRQLVITGRLRAEGNDYEAARAALQDDIDAIEDYLDLDPADYTYKGDTYTNIVFDRFSLVPDGSGMVFHFNSEGEVVADFICYGRQLI